jgi:hypothetical protein
MLTVVKMGYTATTIAVTISVLNGQYAVGQFFGLDGKIVTASLLAIITLCFFNQFLKSSKKYYQPIILYVLATAIMPATFSLISAQFNSAGLLILAPRYLVTAITALAFAWILLYSIRYVDYRYLFWFYFLFTVASFFSPIEFISFYTGESAIFDLRLSGRAIGPYLSVNETAIGICLIYSSFKLYRQLHGINSVTYDKVEFIALAIMILLTGSRAATIFMICALLLDYRKLVFSKPLQSAILYIPIALMIVYATESFPIVDRFLSEDTQESSNLRIESLHNGLIDVGSNILFGNGLGYFSGPLDRIIPHTTLLYFAGENGIPLLILLLTTLYILLAEFLVKSGRKDGVRGGLFILSFIIGVVFDPNIFSNRAMPIWLAMLCYADHFLKIDRSEYYSTAHREHYTNPTQHIRPEK